MLLGDLYSLLAVHALRNFFNVRNIGSIFGNKRQFHSVGIPAAEAVTCRINCLGKGLAVQIKCLPALGTNTYSFFLQNQPARQMSLVLKVYLKT